MPATRALALATLCCAGLAAAELANLQTRTFCDGKGLSWLDAATRQRAAQYRMFYNGPYTASATTANIDAFVDAVKAINPRTRVGLYLIHYEIQDPGSGQSLYSGFKTMSEKVAAETWWLRTTGGARVQWTSSYAAWNICLTGGDRQPADANGERAPEALARIWAGVVGPTRLDFYYNDNARLQNQGTEVANPPVVDYFLDGVGRKSTDAVVQDAFHAAERRYLDAFERLAPDKRRTGNMGNGDDPLSHAAIRKQWDGANMEGFMGLFWSVDSQNGWTTCMNRARTMRDNLRDTGARELSLYMGLTTVQYPMIRYGLCSALLLDDALFGMNIDDQGTTLAQKTYQVDEYLARLGDPTDTEPTTARQNGIWMRRYQGGAVIVNPNDNKGRRLSGGTTLRRTANTVTLSGWANHGLVAGTQVRILDNSNSPSFNGIFTLAAANSAAGTMAWAQTGADATCANGYGRICVKSSIDLTGLGLRHIGGSDPKVGASFQDPAMNTGAVCGVEQLWSSDGFVAVDVDAPADTTAPTVAITSPAAGPVSGTITVEASASDDVAVESVQLRLDGADLGTLERFAPYTATWNTALAAPGSHVLTAVARDAAGNSRTSAGVTVTVALAAPATPTTAPAVSDASSATPTLSGVTQAGATVRIYADGAQIGAVTAAGDGTWSWTVSPPLAPGAHQLTWTAGNAGGTSGQSPSATVTVAASGGAPAASGASAGGACGAGGALALALGGAMLGLALRRSRQP